MAMNWAAISAAVFASAINPPSPNSLQEQIQTIIDNKASIAYGQWYVKEITALAPSNSTERDYVDSLWGVVYYTLKQDAFFANLDNGTPVYYVYDSETPLNGCTYYLALVDGTHPIPPFP